MPIEEDFKDHNGQSTVTTTTKYGLGARGIDYIEKWTDSTLEGCQFPVYDGHGNMVMTLNRTSTAFADANHRRYDVWGSVMAQASVDSFGGPNKKYVANLGHVEDEESELQYMRARYYEPWTGRFISEDPAADGSNWYTYCVNNPVMFADETGKFAISAKVAFLAGFIFAMIGALTAVMAQFADSAIAKACATWMGSVSGAIGMLLLMAGAADGARIAGLSAPVGTIIAVGSFVGTLALAVCTAYQMNLWLELLIQETDWNGSPPLLDDSQPHTWAF